MVKAKPPSSSHELCQKLLELLCQDLYLSQETLHCLQSIWAVQDSQDLQKFLSQAADSERKTLLELIFFPDKQSKLQLQSELLDMDICTYSQSELIKTISNMQPLVRIFVADDKSPVHINLDPDTVAHFVQRLQLDKKLDPELNLLLQERFAAETARRIATEIKSRSGDFTGVQKQLLYVYLSQAQAASPNFWSCLQFALDTAQEIEPQAEIWTSLVRKKISLEQNLRLAHKQSLQLNSQPMEVLLMQRMSILTLDQGQIQKDIHELDQLCLVLYGQIPCTDLPLSVQAFRDPQQ